MDGFDEMLTAARGIDGNWRRALVEVADTAFMCRTWLNEHVPSGWAASDVLRMTEMVLRREAEVDERDRAELDLEDA